MRLYDIKPGTWVIVLDDIKVPPGARQINKGDKIFFDHLDGMYSYCKDSYGNIVHLSGWAEVQIISP